MDKLLKSCGLFFGLCLFAVLFGRAADYFHGQIYFNECAQKNYVRWTNVNVTAVALQFSFDLNTWFDVLCVSQVPARAEDVLGGFEYPATNRYDRTVFMRLRSIPPVVIPPP